MRWTIGTRRQRRVPAVVDQQREPLAEIDLLIGRLYEQAGEYPLALVAYRRASRILESRQTLEAIARVSALSGDVAGAVVVYRRLCRADGGSGEACRTADKLSADGGL